MSDDSNDRTAANGRPEGDEWGLRGSWAPMKPDTRSIESDIDPFDIPLTRHDPSPVSDSGRFGSSADAPSRAPDNHQTRVDGQPQVVATARVGDRRRDRRANKAPAHIDPPRRRASDYEDFPPPRRGRAFLGFLLTLAVIAGGALFAVRWFQRQIDPPGLPGASVEVAIPSNTSSANIAKLLDRNGVVSNGTVFRYWAQLQGKGGFEAGKYTFRKNSAFASALEVLQDGPSVRDENKITIPEGFRIEQIAERVQEKLPGRSGAKFIDAVKSGKIRSNYSLPGINSLEGFLFPDTYTFTLEDDESVIASRMVETFDGVADTIGLASSEQKVGITPYQTLIVASLIEREAKLDADRAKIARVIYNRLRADMYLQIDATLIYSLNNGSKGLNLEDLKIDSPYNSYTNKGLPPGPIANPGRASIDAALNPSDGDWLYYVVTGPDGSHSFTSSFKQHRRNIALAKERGLR